jgi:hypothetical protein
MSDSSTDADPCFAARVALWQQGADVLGIAEDSCVLNHLATMDSH